MTPTSFLKETCSVYIRFFIMSNLERVFKILVLGLMYENPVKNVIESIHKFRHKILFAFLMDRGRAGVLLMALAI